MTSEQEWDKSTREVLLFMVYFSLVWLNNQSLMPSIL